PVGGADLPQPRAGGDQQVRQAEAVADLDQLAAADDDLLSCGEGGGGQDERRGVVVDHVDGSGGGHGGGQRGERRPAAPSPPPGGQVQLDVGGARGGRERPYGGVRQRRPAQVRVEQDAGGVEHRARARAGQRGQRRLRHLLGADDSLPGQVLRLVDG